MIKRNLLIGITAHESASQLTELLNALEPNFNLKVIVTERAEQFVPKGTLGIKYDIPILGYIKINNSNIPIITNAYEELSLRWDNKNESIDLINWAEALLIAPLSANTLAKIAHGIADNLLTRIVRSWDPVKPMLVAPAMDEFAYRNPLTKDHLKIINDIYSTKIDSAKINYGASYNEPKDKIDINSLTNSITNLLKRYLPIYYRTDATFPKVPVGNHPGSFGFKRSHYIHTGTDLYCKDGQIVSTIEAGEVVAIEDFTGPKLGQPYWEDTQSILIRGPSGVFCYGEITPEYWINVGSYVYSGVAIGRVKRVLPLDKTQPKIPGHQLNMLHLELYKSHVTESVTWNLGEPQPDCLLDPTQILLECGGQKLEMK